MVPSWIGTARDRREGDGPNNAEQQALVTNLLLEENKAATQQIA
jgi:hypothetical protein